MFRLPNAQNTARTRAPVGNITSLGIPAKGINARDALALMKPDTAISLNNVLCEAYGLKTRKGYTEWATNLPPLSPSTPVPVATVMSYYPATASPAPLAGTVRRVGIFTRLITEQPLAATPPAGKLFAARGGVVYDVTAGGVGPWTAEAGVSGAGDYWTWLNFQNIAGAWLLACNNEGGYAIYNGATWSMPVAGTAPGEIDGANPANFVYVIEHKKRLWFIEKNTTKAWYLPVGQITGLVKEFNFGEQFRSGGHLVALSTWTVDGGVGVDDHLIAVSSQGDVVVYKGTDPNSAADWMIQGVWHVGPLPVGRRAVFNTGADVHILSQFGVTPVSLLLGSTELGVVEQRRVTYMIGPLVARLMRQYSGLDGWQVRTLAKEELLIIGIPREAQEHGGQYFALKFPSGGWSLVSDVPYASFVNVDAAVFSGTNDGRVVRAFDGPLDNVLVNDVRSGVPIQCQVTPSYQALGAPGVNKRIMLIRPTFITTITPTLKIQVLTDYGPPKPGVTPTLPDIASSRWDEDRWNQARWSGVQDPIKEWFGCHGVGFVATAQLDYKCTGDTVLASIDFWTEQGGVM